MKNGDVFHSYVIYIYYQRVCLKSGTTKSKVKFNGFLMVFEGYTKKKNLVRLRPQRPVAGPAPDAVAAEPARWPHGAGPAEVTINCASHWPKKYAV